MANEVKSHTEEYVFKDGLLLLLIKLFALYHFPATDHRVMPGWCRISPLAY